MYKSLMLLLFLSLISCAPKITIMLDGAPIPDYAYTMRNPATNLSVEVVTAKYIKTYEGDEPILWPVYFGVDKIYKVDPDNTKYVKITVIIRNPNKAFYELKEHVFSKPLIGFGKTEILTKGIYKGRLRYNKFELRYIVKNNTFRRVGVELANKEGSPIIRIGDFSYKVIRPDSEE